MNVMNMLMSVLMNNRNATNIFRMFTKRKRNNSVWTYISLIGLGAAALGLFSRRNNQNMMESVQNVMERFQGQAKNIFEPKMNFANVELGEELPTMDELQNNQNQNNLNP
ncbi:hypothetical protein ACFSCX_13515 [Bacillus salitolerans]|uniref:Uncharacterized protein n=1 Tax=Bacillus salitolerans TaxID=1437434 RepID=A0ABW4LSD1_9BACI